ncbi:divergent protein kinase domain 1B-like isoform X2 [Physella acuta]|uniref:divergent protein kinase domain 1B-like isoform X2 n=1 Tax=Physella acuta TaxID=109671 RepID=UPI0027DD1119|nr:divergent protein kinase domain 1B-like isoform X2 [Physella acuta]
MAKRITFRHRIRCPHLLRDSLIKLLTIILVGIRLCQKHLYGVVVCFLVTTLIWWTSGESNQCLETEIIQEVCKQYHEKYVSSSMCDALCNSKELHIGACIKTYENLMFFQNGQTVLTAESNPLSTWRMRQISEGTQMNQFVTLVEDFLHTQLGDFDSAPLTLRIFDDFDINRDSQINLGEAQSIWSVLNQPYFLAFYHLKSSSAIPHLNGTCGGLSVWHRPHMLSGSILFRKDTPWPVRMFSTKAYRWTLPSWHHRAKVMLSLLEFVEEMYEKDGVRYHLCNADGRTLLHLGSFEIVITEEVMLLSSQQLATRLSNITCHHSHDCVLTKQCQTFCDYSTQQCSGKVVRPTLAYICDIMEDYLLFDAPRLLKPGLMRLIHRCQGMSSYSLKADLLHSVVIIDLKSILWNTIQYEKK